MWCSVGALLQQCRAAFGFLSCRFPLQRASARWAERRCFAVCREHPMVSSNLPMIPACTLTPSCCASAQISLPDEQQPWGTSIDFFKKMMDTSPPLLS